MFVDNVRPWNTLTDRQTDMWMVILQFISSTRLSWHRHEHLPTFTTTTAWSRGLSEKLTGPQLVKKFTAFYGARRFISAFTTARHLSLSWARSFRSMPPSHFSKIYFNIIQPSKPGSFKWTPSLRFPHQTLFFLSCVLCALLLCLLDFITLIFDEEYRTENSFLCSLPHSPVTSSLLGPNILLSTLFTKTLSLHSSNSECDQVSHPYKNNRQDSICFVPAYYNYCIIVIECSDSRCDINWKFFIVLMLSQLLT